MFTTPQSLDTVSNASAELYSLLELHPHIAYQVVIGYLNRKDPNLVGPKITTALVYRSRYLEKDADIFDWLTGLAREYNGSSPNASHRPENSDHEFIFPCEFESLENALRFASLVSEGSDFAGSLRVAVGASAYSAVELLASHAYLPLIVEDSSAVACN